MSKTKATTTIPYFKLDTGKFLSDTMGFSPTHIGYYSLLLVIYWEQEGELPLPAALKRKLLVRSDEEAGILDEVLAEFFPDNKNQHLDSCIEEVRESRKKQSESGKASAAARRARADERANDGDF